MDIDYLLKQVQKCIDESEALNGDGPEYAKLLAYLDKAHADRAHSRIAYGVVAEVGKMLREMGPMYQRGHDALYRIALALGWSGPQPSPVASDGLTANLVSQAVAAIQERDALRQQLSTLTAERDAAIAAKDEALAEADRLNKACDMFAGLSQQRANELALERRKVAEACDIALQMANLDERNDRHQVIGARLVERIRELQAIGTTKKVGGDE